MSADCTICQEVQNYKERVWRTAKDTCIFKWARKKDKSFPVITSETTAVFHTVDNTMLVLKFVSKGKRQIFFFFFSQSACMCMQSTTCTRAYHATESRVSRYTHVHMIHSSLVRKALLAWIWSGQVTQGKIFPEIREVLHKNKCLSERH